MKLLNDKFMEDTRLQLELMSITGRRDGSRISDIISIRELNTPSGVVDVLMTSYTTSPKIAEERTVGKWHASKIQYFILWLDNQGVIHRHFCSEDVCVYSPVFTRTEKPSVLSQFLIVSNARIHSLLNTVLQVNFPYDCKVHSHE